MWKETFRFNITFNPCQFSLDSIFKFEIKGIWKEQKARFLFFILWLTPMHRIYAKDTLTLINYEWTKQNNKRNGMIRLLQIVKVY